VKTHWPSPVLCHHREPGFLWVRLFGWGVLVKDASRHPPTFSERALGHGWRLGRWVLRGLTP
jgi:hypothetical protein